MEGNPIVEMVVFSGLILLVVDEDFELAVVRGAICFPHPLVGPNIFEFDAVIPA